jgi:hypothetical protein
MIKKEKIKLIKFYKGNIIKFFDFKRYIKKCNEIYFSEVKKKYFKGWKFHKDRKQVMTITAGTVDFYFKKKENSKPKRLRLSYPNNLYLIHIPEKIFYCFKCVSKQNALIVNLISKSK